VTILKGFKESRMSVNGGMNINYAIKGDGPPLLLLHGYPQTHAKWHRIAPDLAERFTVVAPDLRGYGDSDKPEGDDRHLTYSKRVMAADQVDLMRQLGFEKFQLVGHDRGARVTHRLCRDNPDRVTRAVIMDIVPTYEVYARMTKDIATAYFHWYFLIQPKGYPETLLGNNAEYHMEYLAKALGGKVFSPEAYGEYLRWFKQPESIHASCEDYRAGATIDLEHDALDKGRKLNMPLLTLWGESSLVGRAYDNLSIWRDYAENVTGKGIPGGHFIAEESPKETLAALLEFLQG
jgi:haloacetate dehalogenase